MIGSDDGVSDEMFELAVGNTRGVVRGVGEVPLREGRELGRAQTAARKTWQGRDEALRAVGIRPDAGKESPGASKYPWEEWTDGSYHVALMGRDFQVALSVFRTMLYNRAERDGLFVATEKHPEGVIGFQFFKSRLERRKAGLAAKGQTDWEAAD